VAQLEELQPLHELPPMAVLAPEALLEKEANRETVLRAVFWHLGQSALSSA